MSAKFLACVGLAGVVAVGLAQNVLTIGDPAPAFKPQGWVKGSPIELKKGNVYVVEFWATWCGPCIAAMPHLSDLADQYKGKADFVSVNVWDRNEPGEKEPASKSHVDRVTKFVKENDAKMRYNIALDDAADTLSQTWLFAAKQNGIPSSFIVDRDGTIAWIGHPMGIDQPLREVVEGKFDKAAFKKRFDEGLARMAAQEALNKELSSAATEGDEAKFRELIAKIPGPKANMMMQALSIASGANAAFALKLAEDWIGDKEGLDSSGWCSSLGFIVRNAKDDATKNKALSMSSKCAEQSEPKAHAVTYGLHARSLVWAERKEEAKAALQKARAALKNYEPAEAIANISKFLDSVEKSITGS